ncbi:MAG: C2H2-type zinc finger protein [Pyrobaculum sp.]
MAAELCLSCTDRGYAVPVVAVTCTICKKQVSWREAVRHYVEHGKKSGTDVVCPICNSKVKSREYRHHVRRHFVKRQDRSYICGICGRGFISVKSLIVHIMKTHE